MDSECLKIRETLQDIRDEDLEIPVKVQNHLLTCTACREYHETLSSLGISLAGEIDENLKSIPPPDFEAVYRATKQRKHYLTFPVAWGIAAVMVFSLGIFFSTLYSSYKQKSEYISRDVELFVSDIFSRPILYNDSVPAETTGMPGWFDEEFPGDEMLFKNSVDMDIYFVD